MKKLLVAPCFNEVGSIGSILEEIKRHHRGDILIIDDGSTDGSDRIIASSAGVELIASPVNRGYGATLNEGFRYAVEKRYDLLVTVDLDEQHEPKMIPRMFEAIGQVDILSGSRYLAESEEDDPAPADRLSVNRRITGLLNRITRYRLTDSFCGFKVYNVAALAKMSLTEPGYAQPLQMWIQANALELSVAEIATPRIYKNLDRSFGERLDDLNARLDYYLGTIDKEMRRWPIYSNVPSPRLEPRSPIGSTRR